MWKEIFLMANRQSINSIIPLSSTAHKIELFHLNPLIFIFFFPVLSSYFELKSLEKNENCYFAVVDKNKLMVRSDFLVLNL